MALAHLTDDEIRTWTREQKDRWWLENIYRGDLPQLTIRSAVTGFLLGSILSATNLYVAGKTGVTLGVNLTSVILAFATFRILARVGLGKDFTILENNAMQSPTPVLPCGSARCFFGGRVAVIPKRERKATDSGSKVPSPFARASLPVPLSLESRTPSSSHSLSRFSKLRECPTRE
jgi:hypothetical protein